MRIEKRVAKRAKSGYTYRVKINYVDEYGIKQTYSKSGFETKKEARAHGVEIEHELQTKGVLQKDTLKTLNDCFLESMELEKNSLSRNTIIHYNDVFKNHVKSQRIAQIPINRINYTMLQTHFNQLKTLGKSLVTAQKIIFNRAFRHALKCGYIQNNPMHDIKVSYKERNAETHVLTYDELENAISCFLDMHGNFNKYSYCIATYCGYYLGLRISEILALEKTDFDFENNVVTISKKLESRHLKKSEMYLTENMKTKASKAVLPLPAPLKTILLEWFAFDPYDLVCCGESGDFIHEFAFGRACKKIGNKLGFNFHPHCLRHTYITNIVQSGCDIKTASKLARHSNTQTTLDVYTHTNEEAKKNAINKVFGNIDTKNAPNLKVFN